MKVFLILILVIYTLSSNIHGMGAPYCPSSANDPSKGLNPMCPPGSGATDPTCVTVQSLLCRASKHNLPNTAQISAKKMNFSTTKSLNKVFHPLGGTLFPSNSGLANQLDAFLKKAELDEHFLIYFAKIHTLLLHELYLYLTKIFTSYNMTHVDKIDDYLVIEDTQALNKKTLIINHLTTIIEAQANQAFLALFPTFPKDMSSLAGGMILKNDYGSNLNLLMENYEDTLLGCQESQDIIKEYVSGDGTTKGMRDTYLEYIGSYLSFFKSYLDVLDIQGADTFISYAQHVQDVISKTAPVPPKMGYSPTKSAEYTAAIQAIRSANKINPPLFFYDGEILRGTRIVPALAKALPKKTQPVQWPAQLVADAASGNPLHNKWGFPIQTKSCDGAAYMVYPAFFTDEKNCKIDDPKTAKHLYVNIPTQQGMYTQEILSDPPWIDSPEGIIKMLRACLGDFSALLSNELSKEPILDPCLYCIIQNAAKAGGLSFTYNQEQCQKAKDFLTMLNQYKVPQPDSSCDSGPTPPDDGGGPDDGGPGGLMSKKKKTAKIVQKKAPPSQKVPAKVEKQKPFLEKRK